MDRHCRSGLLEQRIETTFQVVLITYWLCDEVQDIVYSKRGHDIVYSEL